MGQVLLHIDLPLRLELKAFAERFQNMSHFISLSGKSHEASQSESGSTFLRSKEFS